MMDGDLNLEGDEAEETCNHLLHYQKVGALIFFTVCYVAALLTTDVPTLTKPSTTTYYVGCPSIQMS